MISLTLLRLHDRPLICTGHFFATPGTLAKSLMPAGKVPSINEGAPKSAGELDECYQKKVLPMSKRTQETNWKDLFKTPEKTQRCLGYDVKSTPADQEGQNDVDAAFDKDRVPSAVQAELDVNANACAPDGYEAVWSGKPLHTAVQLALCVGTPAKDVCLSDGDHVKRGFRRPIEVRPDLVTPYKDYVSQVAMKVNDDGTVKAEHASDYKFSATREIHAGGLQWPGAFASSQS